METDRDNRKQAPANPPVEQPNELTGIAPNFSGTVSNRPTNAPEAAEGEAPEPSPSSASR
jgi:hypothetical protein